MAFEFNPFTGSLDSVGMSQASADARYVLKVAGSFSGLTGAGFRDTSAAFDVTLGFTSSAALTEARALTLDVVNASRSIKLAGNVDLGGNFTTTGSGTLALGGYTLTVPATGTAALLGTANVFTAAQTISTAGANSAPPLYLTGALNVAGTGTTTFPHIFHQPTGATAATTWSSGANAGTVFGANETAGFVGNFADFRVAGAQKFSVDADGDVTINHYGAALSVYDAPGGALIAGITSNTMFATGGFYLPSNILGLGVAGYTSLALANSGTIGWSVDGTFYGTNDLIIKRKAAATLQLGADAAGVTNQMFTAASRITSDGPGADLQFAGGNGRGGAGGSLIFSYYTTAAAATIGTLTEAMRITTTGAIILAALPTSDPGVSGQLYKSAGVVMQSA